MALPTAAITAAFAASSIHHSGVHLSSGLGKYVQFVMTGAAQLTPYTAADGDSVWAAATGVWNVTLSAGESVQSGGFVTSFVSDTSDGNIYFVAAQIGGVAGAGRIVYNIYTASTNTWSGQTTLFTDANSTATVYPALIDMLALNTTDFIVLMNQTVKSGSSHFYGAQITRRVGGTVTTTVLEAPTTTSTQMLPWVGGMCLGASGRLHTFVGVNPGFNTVLHHRSLSSAYVLDTAFVSMTLGVNPGLPMVPGYNPTAGTISIIGRNGSTGSCTEYWATSAANPTFTTQTHSEVDANGIAPTTTIWDPTASKARQVCDLSSGSIVVRSSTGFGDSTVTTPTTLSTWPTGATEIVLLGAGMRSTTGLGVLIWDDVTAGVYYRELVTGTVLTRTASDSAGASDTLTYKRTGTSAVDSAPAVDVAVGTQPSVHLSRTASDTAAATDVPTRVARVTGAASDSAPAVDSPTRVSVRARTSGDTAAATDIAGEDAHPFRTPNDSAPATDVATRVDRTARTGTDSAPAADVAGEDVFVARTASDSLPLTDQARLPAANRTGTDSAPATDVAHLKTQPSRASDAAPAIDSPTPTGVRARASSDSAPASDTNARSSARARATSDNAAATDVTTRAAQHPVRTSSDSAPATDSAARLAFFMRASDEAGPLTDVASRLVGQQRTGTDAAPTVETLTRAAEHYARTVLDALGVTDASALSAQRTTYLRPDSIVTQTNLTGALSDIRDSPDAVDSTWMTGSPSTEVLHITMEDPPTTLLTGAGLQRIRVRVRVGT